MSGPPNGTTCAVDMATGNLTIRAYAADGETAIVTVLSDEGKIVESRVEGPMANEVAASLAEISRRATEAVVARMRRLDLEILYGNRKPGDPEPRGLLGGEE